VQSVPAAAGMTQAGPGWSSVDRSYTPPAMIHSGRGGEAAAPMVPSQGHRGRPREGRVGERRRGGGDGEAAVRAARGAAVGVSHSHRRRVPRWWLYTDGACSAGGCSESARIGRYGHYRDDGGHSGARVAAAGKELWGRRMCRSDGVGGLHQLPPSAPCCRFMLWPEIGGLRLPGQMADGLPASFHGPR